MYLYVTTTRCRVRDEGKVVATNLGPEFDEETAGEAPFKPIRPRINRLRGPRLDASEGTLGEGPLGCVDRVVTPTLPRFVFGNTWQQLTR